MAQIGAKSFLIEPLDGENYYNWKFRMELILAENGVADCIKEETDLTTLSEENKKKEIKMDNKAKSLIVQCVKDNQLESLREKKTACSMWKMLEQKHEKKGLPGQLYLKKKMLSMKLNEGESLKDFLDKFDEILRQLKATGVVIDQQDIICNLLLTLPKSFETVVTVIENMPSDKLEYEDVKKKLLAEEEKKYLNKRKQVVATDQTAFGTEMVCFRCGKPGHIKRNCRVNINSQSDGATNKSSEGGSGYFHGYRGGNQYYSDRGVNVNRGFNSNRVFRGGIRGNHIRGQGRHQNQYASRSNFVEQEPSTNQVSEVNESICFISEVNKTDMISNKNNIINFCIDSGCTDHLINNKEFFSDLIMLEEPIKIAVAKNDNHLLAVGVGNIGVYSYVQGRKIDCQIKNVFYVPDLKRNLLSVKRLEMAGIKIIFDNGVVKLITNDRNLIGIGKRNNLYEIDFEIKHEYQCQNIMVEKNDFKLWHKRFAHLNYFSLEKLIKGKMVEGIDESIQICKVDFCEPCIAGKMSRKPFGIRSRSSRILEIVHTDICGPISPIAYDGSKYFITFTDDFSNFTVTYLIKNKSEGFEKFREFFEMTKSMFRHSISKLRCDNGGEYVSGEFRNFCKKNGVILDYTIPYTPQHNGKAERKNRSLVERARTIINESGVPKVLWGEAILSTNYVLNRGPTEGLNNVTPSEMWYEKKPNVNNLRVFGCTVYNHVRKENRDKFDSKVEKCVMVGYAPNGYRLWDVKKNKIIVARDVKFDENNFWYKNNLVEILNEEVLEIENDLENKGTDNIEEIKIIENSTQEQENKRQTKVPARYNDYELYMAFDAMRFVEDVPKCYEDVQCRPDRKLWENAMKREIDAINKNNTWEIVKQPQNTKILDTRWVYTFKSLEQGEMDKYKARLVVRGFAQDNMTDYDEIYSPVARMTTIRTLLSVGTQCSYYFRQLDVKTAFLNGTLDEKVYIYPPQGQMIDFGKVLKLNKSLYGLRQSSKCWNNEINEYLINLGFERSENDHCLYMLNFDTDRVYLLMYVDDLIIAGKSLDKINFIVNKLMARFEIKDKGSLEHFLGLEISYNRNQGILKIHQSNYTRKILNKFNMQNCKNIDTPIDPKLKLCNENDNLPTEKPVRQLIGCLMYLMLGTRPDICFALNFFSRYQNKATDEIWMYLKRILRYLHKTVFVGLEFKRQNEQELLCFVDADWGNDLKDRKSVTGFIFKVFGNTIIWTTKKQHCITLSTTEAELVALCNAVREGLWLKKLLSDFDIDVKTVNFFEDNQGCIALIKNPSNNKRVKHLDLKYNFVCECLEKNYIQLKYVETASQQADILTKGLPYNSFSKLKHDIGLRDFSEGGC